MQKAVMFRPYRKLTRPLAGVRQALVHELQVHQVGLQVDLQVGHRVGQLREAGLQAHERVVEVGGCEGI
jgi:hypothetical protein